MSKMIYLYGIVGDRIGTFCPETGRAQIGDVLLSPERTCRNMHHQPNGFWCSECDAAMEGFIDVSGTLMKVQRCPNCGAKAVE